MRISRLIGVGVVVAVGSMLGYEALRHGDSPGSSTVKVQGNGVPATPSVVPATSTPTGTATSQTASPQTSLTPRAATTATSGTVVASSDGIQLEIVAPETVKAGSEFIAQILVNATVPLRSYTLTIGFDPAVLEVHSTTIGDFMQNGGALAKLMADTGASSDGRITIEVEQDGGSGVEGAGALADVHFKAVSTGGANISISRAELVSGQGQPVVLRPPASAVVNVQY